MPYDEDGERYAYYLEDIQDAVNEFNTLSPHDRSQFYDDFFDFWDFTESEQAIFWEIYRDE